MASFTAHDLKNLFCDRNSWTLVWAWFLAHSYPLEFLSFAILLIRIFIKKLSVKNRNFQRAFLHQALVYSICSFKNSIFFPHRYLSNNSQWQTCCLMTKLLLGNFFFLTEFLSFSYYPFLISSLLFLKKRLPVEYLVRVRWYIAWQGNIKSRKEINIHQYAFFLVLNTFQDRKFMALPSEKNEEYFTDSRIFCPTKICFISYHRLFCGKPKEKLFSKLLKIFRKISVVGFGFVKFL